MRPTDALPHPPDWSLSTIGKEVEIRRGVSWSKDQESAEAKDYTVPVLRITNIQARLELDDILHLAGVPEKARQMKKASKGWSVLVGSNGNRNRIGNAVFLDVDTDFLFASFLIAAKPLPTSPLLPEFFFRWLNAYEVQARLSASAEGSTGLSNLSHDFFKAMEIAFPRPDEQQAIADILDAVDAAIERTRTAIEKAQRLKRGLLRQAFAPGRSNEARLKVWTTDIRYGTSQAANEQGWGHPTLRIPNIIGGVIDTADLTFVDTRPADTDRYALKTGDLLMVRTNGNPNYVGRAAVFTAPDERTWLFASYLIRVRFDDSWLPQFVAEFLNSDRGRRELFRRVSTSAGNYNVNTKNILSIAVPKPSKPEQEEITALVGAANAHVTAIQSQLSGLERLKRGLMQDLLTGRRRVPVVDRKTMGTLQTA